MTDLLERLRDRGWRMTAQRRVVAEVLAGENIHLTADEVLDRATAVLPEISRATVYNTLNDLVEMGEVAELTTDSRSRRYDPNAVHPHHHMSCNQCGQLWDVEPNGIRDLMIPDRQLAGFVADQVDVIFRGLCRQCQT